MRTPQRRRHASGSTGSFGGGIRKRIRGGQRLGRKLSPRWRRRIRPWYGNRDAPVGWSYGRGAVLRYCGVGRLGARAGGRGRGQSRVSATRDTALPRTAAMRDGVSDSEAPAPQLRVLRPPGRPPGQGHPAAGAPLAGALGESTPGVTSGSSHPRANRRLEGEPCCSEFRLFVRPLSPVFVLTWPLVSWSLHFASLLVTAFGLCLYLCLPLASVFFDSASAPSGRPLVRGPNVTSWPFVCVCLSLPMLCTCFSPSQLSLFRQGGSCLDL